MRFLLVFFLLNSLSLFSQDRIEADLYMTARDFYEDNFSHEYVQIDLKEINNEFLQVKKIKTKNGKNLWNSSEAWGIYYKDELYVNAKHCPEIRKANLYFKIDIIGPQMCALFFEDELTVNGYVVDPIDPIATSTFIGIVGTLFDSGKLKNAEYEKSDGSKAKLFIIDFKDLEKRAGRKRGNVSLKLMPKRELHKTFDISKEDQDDVTYESVLELINDRNAAQ